MKTSSHATHPDEEPTREGYKSGKMSFGGDTPSIDDLVERIRSWQAERDDNHQCKVCGATRFMPVVDKMHGERYPHERLRACWECERVRPFTPLPRDESGGETDDT